MVSKILLLAVGAVIASAGAFASGAVQPARVRADVLIIGLVPCNNGTSMKLGTSPAFPNALVQVQCAHSTVTANATTDGKGWFRIARNTTATLSSIVGDCNLVVSTPLASCNSTLPTTGALESPLRLLTSIVLFPRGFSYIA